VAARCGDGVVDHGEGCDDGNRLAHDGCGSTCATERCGDGIVHGLAGEECDDGGLVAGDGCSGTCRTESCGDSVVQAGSGEACDDGPLGSASCTPQCTVRSCVPETCDGADNNCDGEIDEDCSQNNVSYQTVSGGAPVARVKQLPENCMSAFDCNDENIYTTDVCTAGKCSWTFQTCDGPDPDRCTDGRSYGSNVACVDRGPSLLWDFETLSLRPDGAQHLGGAVVDTSGTQNTGRLDVRTEGNATVPSPASQVQVAGKFGQALSFPLDGKTSVSRSMRVPDTEFTLSAWFRTTSATGGVFSAVGKDLVAQHTDSCGVKTLAAVVGHGDLGDPLTPTDREVYLAGGRLAYRVEPATGSRCEGQGARVDDGQWHHAAIVCKRDVSCALYLDGSALCTSDHLGSGSNLARQHALAVGWSQRGGWFRGTIDHVALFEWPMGPADVMALKTGGVRAPQSGDNLERCDGVDNNCDGRVDESCDDGNASTSGEQCQGLLCIAPEVPPCLVVPCHFVSRDPLSGACVSRPDPTLLDQPCNDGIACTADEKCDAAGHCVGALATDCDVDRAVFDPDDPNIIVYDLKSNAGGLTGIIPTNPGTAGFTGWRPAGAPNTYIYTGAFIFSHAVYDPSAGRYSYPHPKMFLTGDVIVGLDPFTLGGTVGLPWTTQGFFGQLGSPVGVGTPSLSFGIQPGSTLQHLGAPLQPDVNYYYLNGDIRFSITFATAPAIPIFGPSAVAVVDPNDPMVYISTTAADIGTGMYRYDSEDVPGVRLRPEAVGFSLNGNMRHRGKLDVWDGTQFIPAVNDAHLYIQGSVWLTPMTGLKLGFSGRLSVNYDPDRNGFDDAEAAGQTGDVLANGGSPAGRADFRVMLEGGLDTLFGPLKIGGLVWINPITGKPVYFPLRLADAVAFLDIQQTKDVFRFRARTADLPFRQIPGLKEIFTTQCTGYDLDVNLFIDKPVGGDGTWGVSMRLAAGIPLGPHGAGFQGTIEFGSSGFVLDGALYVGRLKINPDFDLGTVDARFEFDGERFCANRTFPSPNLILKPGEPDRQTACDVRICIGKNGFDGTEFHCDPFCTGNAECPAGEACVWGVCGAPAANGAPCTPGNNSMCASGRCYAGSCVECWPGQDDCGGGLFCDNAGYCQDKLATGAPCVNVAGGDVMRNDWCLSGKCDTTCVDCWSPNYINVARLQIDPFFREFDCASGQVCSDFGVCMAERGPGESCYSLGAVRGLDSWCSTDSCGDPAWTCRACNATTYDGTALACDADHWCDISNLCQPKWDPPHPCFTDIECRSGHCVAGLCVECVSHGECGAGWCDAAGTCQAKWEDGHACLTGVECASGACSALTGCYTPYAKGYGTACASSVECATTSCVVVGAGVVGYCGCNGYDGWCPGGQVCFDGLSCGTPQANGVPCTYDVLCVSGHCAGLCVECTADAHCGAHHVCASGACTYVPYCGDGTCNVGETTCNCAQDCGGCPSGQTCIAGVCATYCGNGTCDFGETTCNCGADCGGCPPNQACIAGVCAVYCGNGVCDGLESCSVCAGDCGACPYCGDGSCNAAETCDTCWTDCYCASTHYCGAGVCYARIGNGGECLTHAECASGYCDWAVVFGYCRSKQGPGGGCDEDEDCSNGDCYDVCDSCNYTAPCFPDVWNNCTYCCTSCNCRNICN
jgi:cysteine-rich repeat protein